MSQKPRPFAASGKRQLTRNAGTRPVPLNAAGLEAPMTDETNPATVSAAMALAPDAIDPADTAPVIGLPQGEPTAAEMLEAVAETPFASSGSELQRFAPSGDDPVEVNHNLNETAAEATPDITPSTVASAPVPPLPFPSESPAMSQAIDATAEIVNETVRAAADTAATATRSAAYAFVPSPLPHPLKGMEKMMKSTEELVAFGQANMEAFMKSGQIWAAGLQDLTKQMATTAKTSFEESVSTFKAISTAKSIKEAMDLQSSFAKTAFEKAVAESNKITDASIKLTEQTMAPITARVTTAVESFGKAV